MDHGLDRAATNSGQDGPEGNPITRIEFERKEIWVETHAELKNKRPGRLLHPYLTRIQQRYALYLQRQGLPRIPDGAVPETPDEEGKGPTS